MGIGWVYSMITDTRILHEVARIQLQGSIPHVGRTAANQASCLDRVIVHFKRAREGAAGLI